MKLGELLKDWRMVNRISIRSISSDIGVSFATISRFENNKNIDMTSFYKIFTWLTNPN